MRRLFQSVWFALIASMAHAEVITVSHFGGADFQDIQSAVDAAVDGDTILIKPPLSNAYIFGGFTIDGKSLSVIGPTQFVSVRATTVTNLGREQVAFASHLSLVSGVTLQNNTGSVFMRSCVLQNATPTASENLFRDCRSISLVNCRVYGRQGAVSLQTGVEGQPGGVGLEIENARVAIYGGEVIGGTGGRGYDDYTGPVDSNGGPGGIGIELASSELLLAGTDLRGGTGGDRVLFGYAMSGYGGDGASAMLMGAGSMALRRSSLISPGPGGWGIPSGQDGPPINGRVVAAPGELLRVSVPRVALQGEEVLLRLSGEPGLEVLWFESDSLAWNHLGVRPGVLHTAAPIRRIATGVIPPCGEWTIRYRVPVGGAGSGLGVVLQAAIQDPGGSLVLTEPTFLPTLDSLGHANCGARFHVDASAPAGGNGLSWATAFNKLTMALTAVPACAEHVTQVWVAEGIYYPASPGGGRHLKFDMESGTHVYGGFAGGETALRQRDPALHPVILSGDLDHNDAQGIRSDNSYNVVSIRYGISLPRNVRLDGLIIEAGEANTTGGGIIAVGNLDLFNCTIRDCYARNRGAGISYQGQSLNIADCRIIGNRTGTGLGTYAVASGISAAWYGEYAGGSISVVNTIMEGNTGGAGIHILTNLVAGTPSHPYRGVQAEVRHCTIAGNTSPNGTAGLIASEVPLVVTNTVIWGNRGSATGSIQLQQINMSPLTSQAYLCVEGLDGSLSGPGHIGQDPLFVDPLGADGIPGTMDDDHRLGFGSPCIDAGANALSACDAYDLNLDRDHNEPVPVDVMGLRRFRDDPSVPDTGQGSTPIIDIGAHERAN